MLAARQRRGDIAHLSQRDACYSCLGVRCQQGLAHRGHGQIDAMAVVPGGAVQLLRQRQGAVHMQSQRRGQQFIEPEPLVGQLVHKG